MAGAGLSAGRVDHRLAGCIRDERWPAAVAVDAKRGVAGARRHSRNLDELAMSDEVPRDERAERRERKREAERERIRKHGRSIARVYRDAILKRLRRKKDAKS
jgi:hypothetical protein